MAGLAASSSTIVAALLLLAACSGGGKGVTITGLSGNQSSGAGTPVTVISISPAGIASTFGAGDTANNPGTLTTIEPSVSVAPALAQATPDESRYPGATLYMDSPGNGTYTIADVGTSSTGEYVDAYSVAMVCGAGIADDCDRFSGTPEYRIPLAPGALFILLGTDMQPNKPVDFATFRAYAAGPDGQFDGNYDLFEIRFDAARQAASLTADYTP
jgi:hypothetical protein